MLIKTLRIDLIVKKLLSSSFILVNYHAQYVKGPFIKTWEKMILLWTPQSVCSSPDPLIDMLITIINFSGKSS
jgi:hypothetical protein